MSNVIYNYVVKEYNESGQVIAVSYYSSYDETSGKYENLYKKETFFYETTDSTITTTVDYFKGDEIIKTEIKKEIDVA